MGVGGSDLSATMDFTNLLGDVAIRRIHFLLIRGGLVGTAVALIYLGIVSGNRAGHSFVARWLTGHRRLEEPPKL